MPNDLSKQHKQLEQHLLRRHVKQNLLPYRGIRILPWSIWPSSVSSGMPSGDTSGSVSGEAGAGASYDAESSVVLHSLLELMSDERSHTCPFCSAAW